MSYALATIVPYLLGSISFSWLAVKVLTGQDLRQQGSGNLGAKNTLRSLGWPVALLVFAGDVTKGWLALALTARWAGGGELLLLAALMVTLGHNFPFWLRFQGGKGLATAIGYTFYLNLWLTFVLLAVGAIGLALTKKSNPAAIIIVCSFPFLVTVLVPLPRNWLWATLIAMVIFYRHWRDIPDLLAAFTKKSR